MENSLLWGLALVGLTLAACLIPRLMQAARLLRQTRNPRGERGYAFLRRMMTTGSRAGTPRGFSLRGQDLRNENLKDAFLADLDLSDTDLRGVDLTGANLDGAFLLGALYDENTRWPDGFDPNRHGAKL